MVLKTHYLLETSLESLHFETIEWREEVKFYMDELQLFFDMINHKNARNALESQIISDVELNIEVLLDKISKGILTDLTAHEEYLSELLLNNKIECDQKYRDRHKVIAKKVRTLKMSVVNLKKRVYRIFRKNQFRHRNNIFNN